MKNNLSFVWGAHFFCEIRMDARIFRGVKVFCYTGINCQIIKAAFCFLREEKLYQSTVADPGFPRRGCQPQRGVPTYYSAKFYWNQHENERN